MLKQPLSIKKHFRQVAYFLKRAFNIFTDNKEDRKISE